MQVHSSSPTRHPLSARMPSPIRWGACPSSPPAEVLQDSKTLRRWMVDLLSSCKTMAGGKDVINQWNAFSSLKIAPAEALLLFLEGVAQKVPSEAEAHAMKFIRPLLPEAISRYTLTPKPSISCLMNYILRYPDMVDEENITQLGFTFALAPNIALKGQLQAMQTLHELATYKAHASSLKEKIQPQIDRWLRRMHAEYEPPPPQIADWIRDFGSPKLIDELG